MMGRVLGWDVGGANIKAACVDASAAGPRLIERPFALWREPHRLANELMTLARGFEPVDAMAVTMTAELADCFATKHAGVAAVLDAFDTAFPGVELFVYTVDGVFLPADAARNVPLDVAAANWMAGATLVARECPNTLFVDVGSTTADIIPIVGGRVAASGRTDPDRLQSGELVYTGLLRTPVCAIVRAVPFRGGTCRIAAEHFAISADVYRWLDDIDDDEYRCETPDGRGRSRREAGARLARIVCADTDMLEDADVTRMAEHVARAQERQIAAAMRRVARRCPSRPMTAVVAGSGLRLAARAARRASFTSLGLAERMGDHVARATPAAAVALLLVEMGELCKTSA